MVSKESCPPLERGNQDAGFNIAEKENLAHIDGTTAWARDV